MLQGNETSRRTAFGRLAHLWRAFPKSSSIATVCTDGFRQGAPEPSVIGHSGPSTDPRPDITPIWWAWDRSPRLMQLRQEVTYNRRADHKSTGCNGKPIVFQGHGGREVTASFDGGRFSSDGGALLLHDLRARSRQSVRRLPQRVSRLEDHARDAALVRCFSNQVTVQRGSFPGSGRHRICWKSE